MTKHALRILLATLAAVTLMLWSPTGIAQPSMRSSEPAPTRVDRAPAPDMLPFAAASGRLTVYAKPRLASAAAQLASQGEAHLARIESDLPSLPKLAHVQLRLVEDASELASVAPPGRGAPAYAIGVAYPDLGIIAVAARRDGTPVSMTETLRHELAHAALGMALGPNVPRWLHEGFAYQHAGEWTWERVETLAAMAWGGNIATMAELEYGFPAQELPASQAYAQSYDFVGYLSRRGRWTDKQDDGDRWPFRRFLAAFAKHQDLNEAARSAFGVPLAQLYDEWRDDLRDRYFLIPAGVFLSGLWLLAALLLGLGFWRKRRENRRRIALWAEQERAADVARQAQAEQIRLAREAWMAKYFPSAAAASAAPVAEPRAETDN